MLGSEFARITSFKLTSKRDEKLTTEGLRVVAAVREEAGCLHFDIYRAPDKTQFFVHEVWATKEAFDRHNQSQIAARLRSLLHRYASNSVQQWDLELVAA